MASGRRPFGAIGYSVDLVWALSSLILSRQGVKRGELVGACHRRT
jgi:hypothetical protein